MKVVLMAMAAFLMCATGVQAADTAQIQFLFTRGGVCSATGDTTGFLEFLDTGVDTADVLGTLGLTCSFGTMPLVTVSGSGPGAGYDFSGVMVSGSDTLPFTGVWTSTPMGAGTPLPNNWEFTATATGLILAPEGSYTTFLTFTITP